MMGPLVDSLRYVKLRMKGIVLSPFVPKSVLITFNIFTMRVLKLVYYVCLIIAYFSL